jgi:hypothetical protein
MRSSADLHIGRGQNRLVAVVETTGRFLCSDCTDGAGMRI